MVNFDSKVSSIYQFRNELEELPSSIQKIVLASSSLNSNEMGFVTKNITTTTKEAGSIMSGLGATLTSLVNPMTLTIAGLTAVAGAAYMYSTAFDRAKDKAIESVSAYKSTVSEIESLSSALQNTQNQINQLESKGSLNVT